MECKRVTVMEIRQTTDWLIYDGIPLRQIIETRKHGTTARGPKVNTNKLKPEQVVAIREKRNNGVTLQALAEEYGISNNAVSHIVLGKNWQWVGGPIQERIFKDRGANQ